DPLEPAPPGRRRPHAAEPQPQRPSGFGARAGVRRPARHRRRGERGRGRGMAHRAPLPGQRPPPPAARRHRGAAGARRAPRLARRREPLEGTRERQRLLAGVGAGQPQRRARAVHRRAVRRRHPPGRPLREAGPFAGSVREPRGRRAAGRAQDGPRALRLGAVPRRRAGAAADPRL
ncbi:MAG: hypothetical protein AVDCRST_MAG89-905, partial [uncultured Gemmatimonadetes bacterium]